MVYHWKLSLNLAKFLSLLNCVPCVTKTCERANVPGVLICSRANALCVVLCLSANLPRVLRYLTCKNPLHTYVLTCQHVMRAHVSICIESISIAWHDFRDHVITCQHACFDATFFSFAAIAADVIHTVGKVDKFNHCFSSVTCIYV